MLPIILGRTMREKDHQPGFRFFERFDKPARVLQGANIVTETIDLESLSESTLTSSGSFDLRGMQTSSFGKLLQSLPIPAFLIDPQLNIAFANEACSNLDKGYEEIQGDPFCSLFVNTSVGKEVQSVLESVFSSRKPQLHAAVLQIGNSRIWGRMTFRSLRMKECRSVLVMVEDLTLEKKQLLLTKKHQEQLEKEKEDLRKSEERYRDILETIQDGYYEADIAGNFNFFNDKLCEIMGYPRQELKNMNYRQLMDEENASKTFVEFNKIYTGKPHKKIFDHEVTRKDGTKRNVTISISLVRDSSGQPLGFRGICRDITERKRAVNDFARMEKLESIGV